MNFPNSSEPEIQELGGEPLNGSGFENETPSTAFEQRERSADEDLAQ